MEIKRILIIFTMIGFAFFSYALEPIKIDYAPYIKPI